MCDDIKINLACVSIKDSDNPTHQQSKQSLMVTLRVGSKKTIISSGRKLDSDQTMQMCRLI